MKRLLLVPALGLAVMALAAPARAQFPGWNDSTRWSYGDDQNVPYYQVRQTAYDNGYREGLKDGEKDAHKGEYFSYQDEKAFQRAEKGYHRTFGDRDRYRETFRTGYAAGYTEAYERIQGRYGSSGPFEGGRAIPRRTYPDRRPDAYPGPYSNRYPETNAGRYGYYDPAFDNGRNDGYQKGVEDATKRRSFDPLRHEWYRKGDHQYRGEYGPREQYKNVYRRGFQEGYDQGFREGANRNRYRY